jgi:hypothetical protein
VEFGISEIRPSAAERFNEQAAGGGNENHESEFYADVISR